MNSRDYKEIAGIIKKHLELIKGCALFSDADKQLIINEFRSMSIEFADHFEREDESGCRCENCIKEGGAFNRTTFLKDAGVK